MRARGAGVIGYGGVRACVAALVSIAAAVAGVGSWASAASDDPITIDVPAGATSINFPKRLKPTVTCRAVRCSVEVSARLSAHQIKLFGIKDARGGVIGKTFEAQELSQDETSEPLDLFSAMYEPQWAPIVGASIQLPTKKSVPTTIRAEVESTDAAGATDTRTVDVPVVLPWPRGKAPSGKGKYGLVKRIVVPRRISLRAKRARIRVLVSSKVHRGILQSSMIGPGFSRGFLGKFEVTHGGWYTVPMLVSSERSLVRRTRPLVPTTGKVTVYLSIRRRTDEASRWFKFVR